MSRIYILVEGQTEESFINEVVSPFYARLGIYIYPIIVATSRGYKGGLVSYAKVKPQIMRLCKQHTNAWVSTFFDLYALPTDFPNKDSIEYKKLNNGYDKVSYLENQLLQDINQPNFLPFLMLHEFEALLFVEPNCFSFWTEPSIIEQLLIIQQSYTTPEDINDSPHTAPSKRILALMPNYKKVVQGTIIASEIGVDAMRKSCPHFSEWLNKLENLRVLA